MFARRTLRHLLSSMIQNGYRQLASPRRYTATQSNRYLGVSEIGCGVAWRPRGLVAGGQMPRRCRPRAISAWTTSMPSCAPWATICCYTGSRKARCKHRCAPNSKSPCRINSAHTRRSCAKAHWRPSPTELQPVSSTSRRASTAWASSRVGCNSTWGHQHYNGCRTKNGYDALPRRDSFIRFCLNPL